MKRFSLTKAASLLMASFLAVFLPVQGAPADQQSSGYDIQIVDADRTAVIDVSLAAPLNDDSAPPIVVNHLVVSGLDKDSLNSQNGDVLHADLGLFGTGFTKTLRGDVDVKVRVRKFGGGDLTVEQLHKDLSGRWGSSAAASSNGAGLAKSEIVTIGASRYSHLEEGEDEAKAFVALYSLPLMHDCYVEFKFQFSASDSSSDPKIAAQAHALIEQVMQSVVVKTS